MQKFDVRAANHQGPGVNARDTLNLRLSNGTTLALEPSLEAMTTYVVLEQETWFEKELAFLPYLLSSGMTAIDIGANVGVYGLAMARLVAPGRVFAYEPGSAARALLERSRILNQAFNLEILPFALSDSERVGRLGFGQSSELNALSQTGAGEAANITTLDAESRKRGWSAPDFVKMDAEGEEERVLSGGRDFFARFSPLVMFEIKHGKVLNRSLLLQFLKLGYRLFRLLPGQPVLVPTDCDETPDLYELNFFAAKPDRVAALARAGVLVESISEWRQDVEVRDRLPLLMTQPFASVFGPMWSDPDPDYREALAGYDAWRAPDLSLPQRYAALHYAFQKLCALCQTAGNAGRLSTAARVAWEAGKRLACTKALTAISNAMEHGNIDISEPFWPASPRFDAITPHGNIADWFAMSIREQLERVREFSSYFGGAWPQLEWLCEQPQVSIEMVRRRALLVARSRGQVAVSERLRVEAPDHLNAEIWRSGRIGSFAAGLRTG
jgi:FkbM family methyltransferase